ncbi:MAG: arsenate reductase ArsC [Sedimentisphaerales bacterium]
MSKIKDKIKILFLCTGNSCRSQMAEGWTRHLKNDVIEAYSAGISPVGVSPKAIKVMAEAGVDISGQTSKHVDELSGIDFDYVVTLCDAVREQCPVFSGKARLIHRGFEDPTFVIGTEQEIMEAFRKTRDQIKAFIETLPESLEGKNSELAN